MTYKIYNVSGILALEMTCAEIIEDCRYRHACRIGRQILGDQFLCVEFS